VWLVFGYYLPKKLFPGISGGLLPAQKTMEEIFTMKVGCGDFEN
jgi:hypothetical protein